MFSTILLALAFASAATAENPVIDWDAIAVTTVTSGNPIPPPGSNFGGGAGIYLAYAHLAMYNAVNAIDHRFQSYGPDIPAPAGASPEAAAIAAAYTTLKFYFQDQAVLLGNQYAASLAVIPDGATKTNGVQVGEAAGNAIITGPAGRYYREHLAAKRSGTGRIVTAIHWCGSE